MGFLQSNNIVARAVRNTNPFGRTDLNPVIASQKKHAEQRAQVEQATAAMNEAARKQQIDLVSQAQAVAEQQTNLSLRQAAEAKAAFMANRPMENVDVTLGPQAIETPSAQRAKRRKQFFNDTGYSPGVTI